jgi:site-specific DNA recombinase
MEKKMWKIEQKVTEISKRKRVAAYARVSVESERMQHSLSAQISYYSSLIQKNPAWEYAGVYADYGITRTKIIKRKEFQRMLADAEARKIDIILTKSIQRFARNTVDLLKTVRHLKEIGVEVWFEKENICSLSGDGELMLTILASFAQEESRSISENVRWRIKKQFEQGTPNGRFRVYGYRWEGDKLVVVPKEAAVVRRIFQNFLDGKSRLETEREFAAEGITTRNGCRWMDSNIKVVLTNITYTGNMLFQKEYVTDPILKKRKKNRGELPKYYVENTHEPIIDKETFDYVQQEMARRKELGALANKSLNTTCFTGKIKCGICGRSYMHNLRTDRGFEEFWDCGSHKLKGRNCGAKGSIPQAVLMKECTEVLGLDDFDEQAFLDQVEKIVVPEYHVMVFCMKDGRKITRHWVSTAKKDCWTEEYKNRQRAWMKNYMANGKGTRFSAFTTRIRCALCGSSFRRCKVKNDRPVYWRCSKGGQCESVSIREDDLKRVAAEVMGLKSFNEDVFREKVEYIEAGKQNCLIVHFNDGRIEETSYTPSGRRSKARGKESREEWQRQ